MAQSYERFIKSYGFVLPPFQFSNADKEINHIKQYFIAPDYYQAIWGTPDTPVSNIIYAPRGAGKSAQRIMLESYAQDSDEVLAITYTDHDLSHLRSIDEIDTVYHLTYLCRLLLIGLFSRIVDERFNFEKAFTFQERQYLYKLARIYLYNTPNSFPSQAIASLKTIEDRVVHIWENFKVPIVNVIRKISKSKGLEVDLSGIEKDRSLQYSHKDNLRNIVALLRKAGYQSVYVLVDKVDEQSLTGNNAEASFKLIEHLVKDLEILEMPGLCFKFFLWDAIKPYMLKVARPDRVITYELKWTLRNLRVMLDKRVYAYSKEKINDASRLFNNNDLLMKAMLFAELSPRDCVRICNNIMTEQHRTNGVYPFFTDEVVDYSIEQFCVNRTMELMQGKVDDDVLTRIGTVEFSPVALVEKGIAMDVSEAVRIIQPLIDAGLVKETRAGATLEERSKSSLSFLDIRVARRACAQLTLEEFLSAKVRMCKQGSCARVYYRNFDKLPSACPSCGHMNR